MSESPVKPKGLFGRLFGSRDKPGPSPAATPGQEAAESASTGDASPDAEDALQAPEPAAVVETPPPEAGLLSPAEEPAAPPVSAPELAPAPVVAEPPHALPVVAAPPAAEPKKGWFQRLKDGLAKTSSKLSSGITGLFTKRKLDGATLDDLEDLLIEADLGMETATRITSAISKGRYEKGISADEVRAILAAEVKRVLEPVAKPLAIDPAKKPHVILVVGVNGSGKTTTIGKLAQQLAREGRKVMLAAGDTFRAAAIDQLMIWGERTGAPVVKRAVGADASGLAFDALKAATEAATDVLLIDTAGRLQNKQALMEELEKVVRVLRKIDASAPHSVLLVLDATTGQNAMSQVEAFARTAGVTGLVMTKLDGTARGGILVAISARHQLPVHAIGVGEGVDDLQPFDAGEFAKAIAAG